MSKSMHPSHSSARFLFTKTPTAKAVKKHPPEAIVTELGYLRVLVGGRYVPVHKVAS